LELILVYLRLGACRTKLVEEKKSGLTQFLLNFEENSYLFDEEVGKKWQNPAFLQPIDWL
jgi:predicted transposase YbfD/YdcC